MQVHFWSKQYVHIYNAIYAFRKVEDNDFQIKFGKYNLMIRIWM